MIPRILIFSILLSGCASVAPRYNDIGAEYIGAKYVRDALGEGYGYDSDPLIRNDAFDCTTFVETVLAGGDLNKLNHIRYHDGNISFASRNHFIETEWLENNSKLVENVSRHYGNVRTRNVLIDRAEWMRRVHGIETDDIARYAALEYIPYGELGNIENDAPLIVLFISGKSEKYDKIGTDIAVLHMGFLMPGGKVLRHASVGRGIVDDDFAEYAARRKTMGAENIGIALLRIK